MASDLLRWWDPVAAGQPGAYVQFHPTVMKKSSTNPSPAPAGKKVVAKAPSAATKPPAPTKKKPAAAVTAPPSEVPEVFAPKLAAPAPEPSGSLTVVAARVDIGFGNSLFLRGTGPGLNWEQGTPMTNAGSDLWTLDLHGAESPVYCKFLINDEKWSAGPDYVLEPGSQLEVTPLF